MAEGVTQTLYDTLGVVENASYAEIRSKYLSAVLQLHPDKQNPKDEQGPQGPGFLRLQEAWNVLRDPSSRASYDRDLAFSRLRSDAFVTELVRLEEMSRESYFDDGEGVAFVYPCRCGDCFGVPLKELNELGFSERVECDNSSETLPHPSRDERGGGISYSCMWHGSVIAS